jgi:RNA polymerase sigma factor (sigma-70 family)
VGEVAKELALRLRYRVASSDLESLGAMVLCEALTRYDPGRSDFAPYVAERLRWAMMSDARREQRRHRLLAEACGVRDDDPDQEVDSDGVSLLFGLRTAEDPAQAVEQRELRGLLQRSLGALPDEVRTVLTRHYFGEESLEDVARETGRSKATVTRLHHAGLAMLGLCLMPGTA